MTGDRRADGGTGSGESIAVTALLLAVVLVLLAATAGMQASPALVPRLVGLPLAGLLGYVLIRELRARGRRRALDPDARPSQTGDEISAILWLLALPAIATMVGFIVGPALYVFGWARVRAGERLSVALIAAASTALIIQVLFAGLLGVRLPPGILAALLP